MLLEHRTDLELADPAIARGVEWVTRLTLHDLIDALAAFEIEAAEDEERLRNAMRIPPVERKT